MKARPASGWRKGIFAASFGTVNLGENPTDIYKREVDAAIREPIRGEYEIAVLSLKGGAAKTTTTLGLGNAFAQVRTDRAIAIDVNPDKGNLARRVARRTNHTAAELLAAAGSITRAADITPFTNESPARLEVLASSNDPAIAEDFSANDFHAIYDLLKQYYSLIIADCGTGMRWPAMSAVLGRAHTVVVPMSARADSADAAEDTLNYMRDYSYMDSAGGQVHPFRHLLSRTIVVISHQTPGKPLIDVPAALHYFRSRVRGAHEIPYDAHLAEGALVDPALMRPETHEAYRQLAASIATDFGR